MYFTIGRIRIGQESLACFCPMIKEKFSTTDQIQLTKITQLELTQYIIQQLLRQKMKIIDATVMS